MYISDASVNAECISYAVVLQVLSHWIRHSMAWYGTVQHITPFTQDVFAYALLFTVMCSAMQCCAMPHVIATHPIWCEGTIRLNFQCDSDCDD